MKQHSMPELLNGGDDFRQALACDLQKGVAIISFDLLLNTSCQKELFKVAMDFFRLPLNEKQAVKLSGADGLRGYVGHKEEFTNGVADLKESFEFGLERGKSTLEGEQPCYHALYADNVWPPEDRVPGFQEVLQGFHKQLAILGDLIFSVMVDYLDEPVNQMSCEAVRKGNLCIFNRLIHYRHPSNFPEDKDRLVAHTDHTFFSIAFENAPGLEICDEKGVWNLQPIPPGSCVVFPGEVAEAWSGGCYRASPHRVSNTGLVSSRVSATSFFLPDLDAWIHPLQGNDLDGESFVVGDREWSRMHQIFNLN